MSGQRPGTVRVTFAQPRRCESSWPATSVLRGKCQEASAEALRATAVDRDTVPGQRPACGGDGDDAERLIRRALGLTRKRPSEKQDLSRRGSKSEGENDQERTGREEGK